MFCTTGLDGEVAPARLVAVACGRMQRQSYHVCSSSISNSASKSPFLQYWRRELIRNLTIYNHHQRHRRGALARDEKSAADGRVAVGLLPTERARRS